MKRTTITAMLRDAIRESGESVLTLERKTGVQRMSLFRFLSGKQSLRLDKAEILMEYFGFELVKRKGK
jgi:hypothetical protein